jgi:acetylornithine/succinyldiaminopimelate/putrescine aminotransferase
LNGIVVGGASTQSRARRPLPDDWDGAYVEKRGPVSERWLYKAKGSDAFIPHNIEVTWVFDQGGPVLGYTCHDNKWTDEVLRTVRDAESDGLFGPGSVSSKLEHSAAAILADIVGPYIRGDKMGVRFLGNGSDAVDCSLRLARAWTGKDKFISIGYHGSSVVFAHEPQRAGVPSRYTKGRTTLEFGDSQAIESAMTGGDVAAVVVEVPSIDDDARSFLTFARRLCDKHDAMLVLDEVVTGFRLCLGGAAELYGVEPDIACYGKAMSNGRAISAVVGNYDIVEMLTDTVFYSNTYNGDPYNCAHMIGTLQTLQKNQHEVYPYLWALGEQLTDGLCEVGLYTAGHGPRAAVLADDDLRERVSKALIKQGIVLNRPNYICMAHTSEHVDMTVDLVCEVI